MCVNAEASPRLSRNTLKGFSACILHISSHCLIYQLKFQQVVMQRSWCSQLGCRLQSLLSEATSSVIASVEFPPCLYTVACPPSVVVGVIFSLVGGWDVPPKGKPLTPQSEILHQNETNLFHTHPIMPSTPI